MLVIEALRVLNFIVLAALLYLKMTYSGEMRMAEITASTVRPTLDVMRLITYSVFPSIWTQIKNRVIMVKT